MEAIRASSARRGPSLSNQRHSDDRQGRDLLSEEAFCDWLAEAMPGQRLVYHRGLIAQERMASSTMLAETDRVALVRLAKRTMQAADDGHVLLVQRRLADADYAYVAVKASRRRRGRRAA